MAKNTKLVVLGFILLLAIGLSSAARTLSDGYTSGGGGGGTGSGSGSGYGEGGGYGSGGGHGHP
ncbi:hypothetical protein DsansV1_C05g0054231 [Dioscorea sansibarensis]